MHTLLQINSTLNWGSTGKIAEQIGLLAQDQGWHCYFAHGGRYKNESLLESIQVSSKWDNYAHAIYGEVWGKHGLGSSMATRRFLNIIEAIKPDVIHIHNMHGYYVNYEILLEYIAYHDIPLVWTLHDCWAFTGHCTHFEMVNCTKWKNVCGHCPLLVAQYKSRIFDNSHSNFLIKKALYSRLHNVTIVPVSRWLGDLVSESILGKFPIKVIHNGIDLNIFTPKSDELKTKLGIAKEKKIVLGVMSSGFDVEKGVNEFIRLASHQDFQIILVGISDKNKKKLPPNILCINRINNQAELANYYSISDVYLNPTYNDTFPTTNIEALACGTPVVTYRTGGSPEALDDKTGVVVEKGNYNELVEAIDIVLKRGKSFYSSACRERAEKFFNKDERFADYISLYESLIV